MRSCHIYLMENDKIAAQLMISGENGKNATDLLPTIRQLETKKDYPIEQLRPHLPAKAAIVWEDEVRASGFTKESYEIRGKGTDLAAWVTVRGPKDPTAQELAEITSKLQAALSTFYP